MKFWLSVIENTSDKIETSSQINTKVYDIYLYERNGFMANIMHEDAILKMGMDYFRDTLLKLLGVEYEFIEPGPTELVELNIQKMYLDYTFPTTDDRVIHFEFQTTSSGLADLRRFHAYEAVYQHNTGKKVLTYVIYTGGISKTMDTLDCGLYTYRVYPIYLIDKDADAVIDGLTQKQKARDDFTDEDFAQLALAPLMGSEKSRKEIIKNAVLLIKPYNHMSAQKALAMVYALADKFLEGEDLSEIKEDVAMTKLGQMIYDDGVKDGQRKGLKTGLDMGIKALTETCRELGVDYEQTVQRIISRFNMTQAEAEEAVRRYWK